MTGLTMSALPHSGGSLGTTRNRTDVFLKYRNQARGVRPAAPDVDNGKESSRCAFAASNMSQLAGDTAGCIWQLHPVLRASPTPADVSCMLCFCR